MFDNLDIFYFYESLQYLFSEDWQLDHDKISNLKCHKLVIADFSREHYGPDGLNHVYDALEQHKVNFLLLSHDFNDHLIRPRILFYPYWYFKGIELFTLPKEYSDQRQYLWSCQNLNPRPHRIYNFFLAQEKDYFDQGLFLMRYDSFEPGQGFLRKDNYLLDPIMIEKWRSSEHSLPDRQALAPNRHGDIFTPVFTDSYINLVTETTVIPRIFITEKTWKPIAAQQLFLIFGNPGTIQVLRQLGVDVFDDVIDHSYDLETDWKLRLDKIYNSLEKLLCQDLRNIYQLTQSRRKHNANLCQSGAFGHQYQKDLQFAVDNYLK